MGLADGIRKHGFRKWYERELMAGHAYMVLALLALLGGLGALELYTGHPPGSKPLVNLMSMLLCAAIGWWSVRRYLYLLAHAEFAAHQAVCPGCKVYGKLELASDELSDDQLRVRCKKCRHGWTIEH